MDSTHLATRRLELIRKRWNGTITSAEQDGCDELEDRLREIAAYYASLPQLQEIECDG